MEPTSLQFARAARTLSGAARAHGLRTPGFRSPPRLGGVHRSLRWRPDGGATVAVVVRGRPFEAVLADMIEGIVVANRLAGGAADSARAALWGSVAAAPGQAA